MRGVGREGGERLSGGSSDGPRRRRREPCAAGARACSAGVGAEPYAQPHAEPHGSLQLAAQGSGKGGGQTIMDSYIIDT